MKKKLASKKNRTRKVLPALVAGILLTGSGVMGKTAEAQTAPTTARIRAWQEYPFVKPPAAGVHRQLWEDFTDLPEWCQRGRIVYGAEQTSIEAAKRIKENGAGLLHVGPIRALSAEQVKTYEEIGLPLVLRLDGQMFWGDRHNELMETLRPGGWAVYHSTVPNNDWFRKFPASLSAAKFMRDGQPMWEYYGSNWVMRRDINYIHPAAIQMRDAFLRECLLGEQVFDRPIGLAAAGHASGVWWDNPGNIVESYDAYTQGFVANEVKRLFEKRFRQRFEAEFNQQPALQKRYPTPEAKENLFYQRYQAWYVDPLYFWMRDGDEEVLEWWNRFWAEAYAGYYAWQYQYIQNEIAPKLGKKHLFVGGNSKLCWSSASWDYYAFSWGTYDLLGPNETTVVYSDKHAPGFKLALAASNGKPAALWNGGNNDLVCAEALACLGVVGNQPEHLTAFQKANFDLYQNARPGGRVACLYHLEDGLHHSEIANLCRVTDQVGRSGVPLEIITEKHLGPEVLDTFDLVILPGFRFTDAEAAALRAYAERGGRLLLLGDNRDRNGRPLAEGLAGLAAWTDGEKALGKGQVRVFGSQLIDQAAMDGTLAALKADAFRITSPAGANLLLNILTQPKQNLVTAHLVNFTGQPVENVRVRFPDDLNLTRIVYISPYGSSQTLKAVGKTVTIPRLSIYGIICLCPNERIARDLLERNRGFNRTFENDRLPRVTVRGGIPEKEWKLSELAPGEKLCQLRQFTKTGFRRLDADVVTAGRGRVGTAQPVKLRIHALGVWNPEAVFLDRMEFVFVHEASGHREIVPLKMEPVSGQEKESGADERQKSQVQMPAGT
ncbi:MAG TPA: hypothetical protein PKN80_05235, partial [bacterium]|nr:hypothetical protein [bacterium]